ncbi:hypothetical protein HR12_46980, partial [Microbacterium sp. SUBG005]
MDGEGALHADLEADLADAEGLAHAVARAADDDALEHLDARAVAFGDVDVHLDGVAGGAKAGMSERSEAASTESRICMIITSCDRHRS